MRQTACNPTQHHLNKDILRLAVPAVVSNITVPLLGLVDTAVSGHLGDTAAIGAIAVGAMMLNVAYWLFGFLRTGTTGLTAVSYGAGDIGRCRLILWRALTLAITVGVILMLLNGVLSHILIAVTGASEDVASLAVNYYSVCICGAPALLATMSVSGWMVGMQSTTRPMIVAVTTNIINILLTIMLVFVAGLGFIGVAFGTLAAQWLGLILALWLAGGLGAEFTPLWSKTDARSTWLSIIRGNDLRQFFRVNSDLMIRSACIMAVSVAVTSIGARLGTVILAANAVIMQFFIFFSYFMDGFAFAGEALTGKFKGASETPMLRRSVTYLLGWSAVMAISFFLIYYFFYFGIAGMITTDTAVLECIRELRIIVWLLPPLSVAAFICDGFYIGMTDTRRLLAATLGAAGVFFAVAFIPSGFGLPGEYTLWYAFLSYLTARGILLGAMLPGRIRFTNNSLPGKR